MKEDEFIKLIDEGKIISSIFYYVLEKSKDSEGKINNLGKTLLGILGSLILMFFFMIGYSFLYGIYFGNSNKKISILDIGLNIVPIDAKFVISIGILILILTCIFIIPIKYLFFKKSLFIKITNIWGVIFCAYVSIWTFKYLLVGNTDITYEDLYLVFVPIFFPLLCFGILYFVKEIFYKESRIIFLISLLFTTIIFAIILEAIIIKDMDSENLILLGFVYMPIISIISRIIEVFFYNSLELILRKLEDKSKIIKSKISFLLHRLIDQFKSILYRRGKRKTNTNKTKGKHEKCTLREFCEIILYFVICIIVIFLISMPGIYLNLGNYYGIRYPNNKQVILYLQNNIEKEKIGNIVGCKDGNYYISEYPNKNLVIIKSTQAVVETYVTGWHNIDNKWYYFDSKGVMLVNSTTPDGYKVDENGALVQ